MRTTSKLGSVLMSFRYSSPRALPRINALVDSTVSRINNKCSSLDLGYLRAQFLNKAHNCPCTRSISLPDHTSSLAFGSPKSCTTLWKCAMSRKRKCCRPQNGSKKWPSLGHGFFQNLNYGLYPILIHVRFLDVWRLCRKVGRYLGAHNCVQKVYMYKEFLISC